MKYILNDGVYIEKMKFHLKCGLALSYVFLEAGMTSYRIRFFVCEICMNFISEINKKHGSSYKINA